MSTFGEELRRERELREITLREVSQATKISLRYLEAMERNDFSYLPGGVFNRGFVRAYCDVIGVDPESMVNAYLLEEQAQTVGDGKQSGELLRGPLAELRDDAAPTGVVRGRPLVRWGLLVAAVGLLAASVWVYLRFIKSDPQPIASPPSAGVVDLPDAAVRVIDLRPLRDETSETRT